MGDGLLPNATNSPAGDPNSLHSRGEQRFTAVPHTHAHTSRLGTCAAANPSYCCRCCCAANAGPPVSKPREQRARTVSSRSAKPVKDHAAAASHSHPGGHRLAHEAPASCFARRAAKGHTTAAAAHGSVATANQQRQGSRHRSSRGADKQSQAEPEPQLLTNQQRASSRREESTAGGEGITP